MNVKLLKNTSNTKSFNRNFTKNITLTGYLKEGSDMLSPSFTVQIDNPTEYNMMQVPDFNNRYYFIGWRNISDNMWEAYTKEIDVLYTYKSSILGLNAIIDKQEYRANLLLDDGSFVSQVDTFPETINFTGGFNDNEKYVLITAG